MPWAVKGAKHKLRCGEFTNVGGGIGKGTAALCTDGEKVREGRIERKHAFLFSKDETTEIGCDAGEPVSEDYPPRDNDNGKVNWVQIDVDAAAKDVDHKIGAEERFMVAVARQ